jgi:hypothetical protein
MRNEPAHRYKVGQMVGLARGFGYVRAAGSRYRIVSLLPRGRTHFQYRIRGESEAFERVASENELTELAEAPVGAGGKP